MAKKANCLTVVDRHADRLTEWFLVLHFAAKNVLTATSYYGYLIPLLLPITIDYRVPIIAA